MFWPNWGNGAKAVSGAEAAAGAKAAARVSGVKVSSDPTNSNAIANLGIYTKMNSSDLAEKKT